VLYYRVLSYLTHLLAGETFLQLARAGLRLDAFVAGVSASCPSVWGVSVVFLYQECLLTAFSLTGGHGRDRRGLCERREGRPPRPANPPGMSLPPVGVGVMERERRSREAVGTNSKGGGRPDVGSEMGATGDFVLVTRTDGG